MDGKLGQAEWHHESDKLVILVEVVLRLDVVFATVGRACEAELGRECYIGVVERNEPERKQLGDVEVKD